MSIWECVILDDIEETYVNKGFELSMTGGGHFLMLLPYESVTEKPFAQNNLNLMLTFQDSE